MQLTNSIRTTTRVGFVWCCLLIVSGCLSTKPLTSSDTATVLAQGQTLVVLRIAIRSQTGEFLEPFASTLADDNPGVAIGNFKTGGELERTIDMRFLSDESRSDGWFAIILESGTHYFAFLPPRRTDEGSYSRMFNTAERWRVDAPTAASIVYAGSLIIDVDMEPLFFGGEGFWHFGPMEIIDETGIARSLAQQIVPASSDIKTVLMVKHEGPVILTTPEN